MKKAILFMCIFMTCYSSAQSKKKVIKSKFDENYVELLSSINVIPSEVSYYNDEFRLGSQYEKPILLKEDPTVSYLEKTGMYKYVIKLDDVNFSIYLKDNRIVEKVITVFDLTDFLSLMARFEINGKEFISGKGFKINETIFVYVSKTRQDTYDSYTFDFRSPEFFNIRDLVKSKAYE